MKITIYSVLNVNYGGGFERWLLEVAPRLRGRGHDVTVVTTDAGIRREHGAEELLRSRGVELIEVGAIRAQLTLPDPAGIARLLEAADGSDVLYFNNAFAGNELIVLVIRKLSGTPVLSAYHGTFPDVGPRPRRYYHRALNMTISRAFDGHHVLNKDRYRLLRSLGYRRVFLIPNGVDTARFRPGNKAQQFTALFVGRFTYQKGIDIFVRVAGLLRGSGVRFVAIGDAPPTISSDAIEFLGRLSDEDLVRLYQEAHVLVAPSRYEELHLASIEAQACGTPVIASNIPGPRDVIVDGATGFLVRPDPVEIAAKILYLAELWRRDGATYREISRRARENALRYDWEIMVKLVEGMLSEVALGRSSRGPTAPAHALPVGGARL
ncbi:MAG: glycosyltransferase family 4 protein [Conexivisphaera sp.]